MTTLDENQVIDIVSGALGATSAAHQEFAERHNLKHATAIDSHKSVSTVANALHYVIAPAGLPLNSTGDARNCPSDADLQMSIELSSVQFPAKSNKMTESQAQARILDDNFLPVNASCPAFVEKAKSSNCHLAQPQNAQCPQEDVSIELQEVVVHGSESSAGILQPVVHLPRAMAPLDIADERSATVSKLASFRDSRGIRANKIIGALAPDRKGNAVAKLSASLRQCRAEAAVSDHRPRQVIQIPASQSVLTCSITQCSDGGLWPTTLPPPPPRSRSSSRVRHTNGCDATDVTRNGKIHEQPSLLPADVDRSKWLAPLEVSSLPHCHPSASDLNSLHSVTMCQEKSPDQFLIEPNALKGDNVVRLTNEDAQRPRHMPLDGDEQQVANPPRSRSHSRHRKDAAGNPASVHASISASTTSRARPVPIAPSASVSLDSSTASELMSAWIQRLKIMKDRPGDRFEKC